MQTGIANKNILTICDLCKDHGYSFQSTSLRSPDHYIEGPVDAEIWIIGLNPKGKKASIESRSLIEFSNFNPDSHSYFTDLKKVSPKLFEGFKSKNSNVAHTDLIKCFSESYPPVITIRGKEVSNAAPLIANCSNILKRQILLHKPKIIVCNGRDVSQAIKAAFKNSDEGMDIQCTSYVSKVTENYALTIILSGYIGRIDDYNKRRLGQEIERIAAILKISFLK